MWLEVRKLKLARSQKFEVKLQEFFKHLNQTPNQNLSFKNRTTELKNAKH